MKDLGRGLWLFALLLLCPHSCKGLGLRVNYLLGFRGSLVPHSIQRVEGI